MIDFRYHLVSLAAVLIALSVGIVLGAGPLNDDIGNTLSGEVTKLRGEKEDLRRQLGDADRGNERRDVYDEAYLSQVVEGRLDGRTVAVVALPQSDDGVVESVSETVQDAGATVTDPVRLEESWTSGTSAAADTRERTGDRLLTELGVPTGADDEGSPLDRALGALLVGRADDRQVDEDAREAAWERLGEDGLVSSSGDVPAASDLVVVVGAPVPATDVEEEGTRQAEAWVRLAGTLDRTSSGAVLCTPQRDVGSNEISLVTTAREEGQLSDGLSTVDAPEVPIGRAGVVLALVEQLDGDRGHYGLGPDASAAVPDVP